METDELMIVESSSSLHLTVSEEEPAPALSKLSSSSSASSASDDDESSTSENEASEKLAAGAQNAQSEDSSTLISKTNNNNSNGEMEKSGVDKEGLDGENAVAESAEEEDMEEQAPSKTEDSPQLEILNSEQQVDGSLHIEIKDDGCGDPEEAPSAKIQRLARKAGIIVGGGTMTAVGTVMLFLPCPTPSIYLMIGGMAIMSKEIPAAQRHLDTTREGLKGWVERAEKEFAEGVRTITVVVDNGSPTNKKEPTKVVEEEEVEEVVVVKEPKEKPTQKENRTPNAISSTQVVHQRKNPVKKHLIKSCRNVIIPLLNKVCTPQELLDQQQAAAAAAAGETSAEAAENISREPIKTPTSNEETVPENASPVPSPFARWAKYRENRREELVKAEEKREREAMLARINEANLKQLQQEANIENKVVEENQEEEDDQEEEDEEIPELSESLQRLMFQSESAVIRV